MPKEYLDLDRFDPQEHFKDYHYYEIFDPEINLEKFYIHDYGHGPLRYQMEKYTFIHTKLTWDDLDYLDLVKKEKHDRELVYMVAKERLTDEERDSLIPYCTCLMCSRSYFNPARYFGCPCCVGCLTVRDHYYTRQYMINAARKRKNSTHEKLSFKSC